MTLSCIGGTAAMFCAPADALLPMHNEPPSYKNRSAPTCCTNCPVQSLLFQKYSLVAYKQTAICARCIGGMTTTFGTHTDLLLQAHSEGNPVKLAAASSIAILVIHLTN